MLCEGMLTIFPTNCGLRAANFLGYGTNVMIELGLPLELGDIVLLLPDLEVPIDMV